MIGEPHGERPDEARERWAAVARGGGLRGTLELIGACLVAVAMVGGAIKALILAAAWIWKETHT